ncbi:hypothetical protein ACLMJK_007644 [Lecanora helva]
MAESIVRLRSTQLFILALLRQIGLSLTIQNGAPLSTSNSPFDHFNLSIMHNSSFINSLTGRWDAECQRLDDPPIPAFIPHSCYWVAESFCVYLQGITPAEVLRNKWYWIEVEGCAAGFYLAPNSFKPRELGCRMIVEKFIEDCAQQTEPAPFHNVGSNNAEKLPDFSQNSKAEDPEQAMIVLASERLTL